VATIERYVGVYNANGSLTGELAYFVGKRLGRAHCALCDITHGLVSTKPAWQRCRIMMPVRFDTVHLDERDDELRALTEGQTPCVVVEGHGMREILLGPDDLEQLHGSPEALVDALAQAAGDRGWSQPAG
jgi:hypothetical protein